MEYAPIGVFALLAGLIVDLAGDDPNNLITTLKPLLYYAITVLIGLAFMIFIFYPIIIYSFTGVTFLNFLKAIFPAQMLAFSTSSSAATLPITLSIANDNFKTNKGVSNFVLPLGATMNMDGTALYEAAAALFIANLVGMDLTLAQQLILFLTAMVASIGAPGIPSAGMVTMAMVLQVLGLPLEALALLLPMDRLLDTFRTTINVEGDLTGALIVQKIAKL